MLVDLFKKKKENKNKSVEQSSVAEYKSALD